MNTVICHTNEHSQFAHRIERQRFPSAAGRTCATQASGLHAVSCPTAVMSDGSALMRDARIFVAVLLATLWVQVLQPGVDIPYW
jgi:hypothetical protein